MNAAVKATARGNNKKHSTHKPLKVWHFCWLTLQQCLFSKIGNQAVLCVYTQLCLTRCDPMVCSLPGSSVHGILQARILEWVAISFSRGSSWPRNQTHISCIGVCVCVCVWKSLSSVQLFVTPWNKQSMEFSRPEYWSGYPSLVGRFFTIWATREAK